MLHILLYEYYYHYSIQAEAHNLRTGVVYNNSNSAIGQPEILERFTILFGLIVKTFPASQQRIQIMYVPYR